MPKWYKIQRIDETKGCEKMIQLDQINSQLPALQVLLKEAGESL